MSEKTSSACENVCSRLSFFWLKSLAHSVKVKMNKVSILRYTFLLTLFTAIILGIFVFPSKLPMVLAWIRSQQLVGSILFIIIQAVCIWCISPVSIFIIAAGFMYGLWFGSLIAYIGYVLGMVGSFFFGKTLLRQSIQAWLYEKYPSYESIDRAIGEQGFKILLLFRLSPVMPCNVMNYLCSLTKISFASYVLASVFGVIPTVFIFANIGAMIANLSGNGFENVVIPKQSKDMMILLSCVFTTLSVVLIGIITKKALRQQLLPVADERIDLSKPTNPSQSPLQIVEGNVNSARSTSSSSSEPQQNKKTILSGFLYIEKVTILFVLVASIITLIVGCTLILTEGS